ncbi:MAG: hypothetical protein ACFBSF_12505 [Leptolyngbyaceae cyanobacterium]
MNQCSTGGVAAKVLYGRVIGGGVEQSINQFTDGVQAFVFKQPVILW